MKFKTKNNYYISVQSEGGQEEVFVSTSSIALRAEEVKAQEAGKLFWYTTDRVTEVGESVVIENSIGARVAAKRVK